MLFRGSFIYNFCIIHKIIKQTSGVSSQLNGFLKSFNLIENEYENRNLSRILEFMTKFACEAYFEIIIRIQWF